MHDNDTYHMLEWHMFMRMYSMNSILDIILVHTYIELVLIDISYYIYHRVK